MAHGLNAMLKRGGNTDGKTGIGSRRIFAPQFKLQVLDSYRNDADCKGNQRATARKYGIHRRQIQKWLQVENNLRSSVQKSMSPEARKCGLELALSHGTGDRQRDDVQRQLGNTTTSLAAAVTVMNGEEGNCGADKRVPDIPQPAPIMPVVHEWRRCGSPTTVDSASLTLPPVLHPALPTALPPPTSPPVPLDLRRSPDPAAPIDLSLKPRHYPQLHRDDLHATPTPPSPPVSTTLPLPSPLPTSAPNDPNVWDLSTKNNNIHRKRSHEDPITIQHNRPIKLFKPYLDHVIEEQLPSPPQENETFSPNPDTKPFIITNLDSGENYTLYNNNNNNYQQPDYQVDYTLYNDYYYTGSGLLPIVREPFTFSGKSSAHCMKQRQSYSLDFKLSAIECYYSDAVCRGNQRAVASKFKIHRRQVQKWLKQEEQLRQRMQPLHIVR